MISIDKKFFLNHFLGFLVMLPVVLLFLWYLEASLNLSTSFIYVAAGIYSGRIQLSSATVNRVDVLKNTSYGVLNPSFFLGR